MKLNRKKESDPQIPLENNCSKNLIGMFQTIKKY